LAGEQCPHSSALGTIMYIVPLWGGYLVKGEMVEIAGKRSDSPKWSKKSGSWIAIK